MVKVILVQWFLNYSCIRVLLIFKRSWQARALLNIDKFRDFVCSYLFLSSLFSLLESLRVSMGLSESQQVSASLSESQQVSASLSESQRVSVSLSKSQWVSASLSESQLVSVSLSESLGGSASLSEAQWVSINYSPMGTNHRIKLIKLIWANKVNLNWSSYFPNF